MVQWRLLNIGGRCVPVFSVYFAKDLLQLEVVFVSLRKLALFGHIIMRLLSVNVYRNCTVDMAAADPQEVQKHSVHTLVFRSLKRTHDMFLSDHADPPAEDEISKKLRMKVKAKAEYGVIMALSKALQKQKKMEHLCLPTSSVQQESNIPPQLMIADSSFPILPGTVKEVPVTKESGARSGQGKAAQDLALFKSASSGFANEGVKAMLPHKAPVTAKPVWHAPWKLYRVISGHTGWVRCVDVEPGNEWFATGAADRIIKIWDLATGTLKLSLTGHVSAVRAVKISHRQPYLFSAGEDKQVKCWDLEYNKVVRHYHGHLSAVYALTLHPSIDVVVTASRDATVRVWDMRTKANVHTLVGHTNTVACVVAQEAEPQLISGSHDSTIRLWDLAAGKCRATLTNHKKSVRGLAIHPSLYMFASASPENIKQWKCPNGEFMQNLTGHNAILNTISVNPDGVLVSGADNGSMHFWDWRSGFCFQKTTSLAQPGSIDSEAGVFASCFDQSGSRLITCEADKSIKMYREDEEATEETHPLLWRPELLKRKVY